MTFDFDRPIDRRNTNSLKYDFALERGKPADVLPLWVADMDFAAPPAVTEALQKAVSHGIFGYSDVKEDYSRTVAGWFSQRFGWETRPEWLVKTPGVVYALAMAVRALTEEGDAVLVQPPVYYPFYSVVRSNGRRLVENQLVYEDGRYHIDFDAFEKTVRSAGVKLFLLCSPHNPVCRVWTEEELRRMGAICQRYGVIVVSDEIHCDCALPGHPHTVFPLACPDLAERSVICTAPSKTFNLAGLQVSNIFIPGQEVRRAFRREVGRSGYSQLNSLGLVAAQAAYREGGAWLEACRTYLQENLAFLRSFLTEKLPEVRLVEPEGTYFAWLDCSALGLTTEELEALVTDRARLWLDGGSIFGACAGQFQRMVLACTRATLSQALDRLERAVHAPEGPAPRGAAI